MSSNGQLVTDENPFAPRCHFCSSGFPDDDPFGERHDCWTVRDIKPPPPSLDLDEVMRWINLAYPLTARGLLHVCSDLSWSGQVVERGEQNGYPPRLSGTVAHLDQRGARGIYLAGCTLRPAAAEHIAGGGRGRSVDAQYLVGVWSDLDYGTVGHRHDPDRHDGLQLPPDEAAARFIIPAAGLVEPTAWIASGGGLYAWWLLEEPALAGPLADLVQHWQSALGRGAASLGYHYGTGVGDLARVLRLPGTVNRKVPDLPRACRILSADGPRYEVEDLEAALARVRPEPPPAARVPGTAGKTPVLSFARLTYQRRPGEISALDDFEARVDWDELVTRAEGTFGRYGTHGERQWVRPGKTLKDGISATTGFDPARDRIKIFTDAWPPFEQGAVYTKPGFLAALAFGGDHKALAAELRSQGYGTPPDPGGKAAAGEAPGHESTRDDTAPDGAPAPTTPAAPTGDATTAEPAAASAECPHEDGSPEAAAWWRREWRAAIERGEVEPRAEDAVPRELPPFPLDALPGAMRNTAVTIAANKQVPVDIPALLCLTCVAVVAGPRLTISRGRNWIEPLIEWTLSIAESGERKTPAVAVILDVIQEVEKFLADQHAKKIAAAKAALSREIDALTRPDKTMTRQQQDLRAEQVRILKDQVDKLGEQKPPQILTGGSSTLEAVERAMAGNGGAMAVIDDEGGAFGIISGIYNDGVPTGLETVLKGYTGVRVPANERITRATENIPRAVLTYGITVQSAVLAESFGRAALRDRGLHARWLYAMPEPLVGSRSVDPPDLDYLAVDAFTAVLVQLAALPLIDGNKQSRYWPALELSPEARKLHVDLQVATEPRLNPDSGDLAFMGDWGNKYVGRVLRHAGLLHLAAGYGPGDPVSEVTMRAAVTIGEWALAHAADVYRRAPKPTTKKGRDFDARTSMVGRDKVRRWITRTKTVRFTGRDVFKVVRKQAWCDSADDLQQVLLALHGEGLLRPVPRRGADGRTLGGAPWWVAHPDLIYRG